MLAQVVLAAFIGGVATAAGGDYPQPDAIPRGLALLLLYLLPAGIADIGSRAERRSIVLAAALLCLIGSSLAFSGVTLVFLLPAILFGLATFAGREAGDWPDRSTLRRLGIDLLVAPAVVVLGVGAAVALFGMTRETCWSIPGGSACGSGILTWEGVAVAALLGGASIGIAWLAAGGARRLPAGTPPTP
jgi:hypothetical protein